MAIQGSLALVIAIFLSCLVGLCYGISFSGLDRSLVVTATSTQPGQVLKGGKDSITISWSLNATFQDSSYNTVEVKLCYAKISQKDRGWRKTEDELEKDKACQHKIVSKTYNGSNNTITWTIKKDVPTATYFVRAYVFNSAHHEVAYGQTTDLFVVEAVSGRHATLDIASVCFSAFSIVSLFGFFFMEKRKAKLSQQN